MKNPGLRLEQFLIGLAFFKAYPLLSFENRWRRKAVRPESQE